MKTTLSNPNPYDVLGVSQAASNAEITKAFALAMKRREYSTEAIAKAKGIHSIQVASFINSSEAYQFAEILRREIGSREVGESSIH